MVTTIETVKAITVRGTREWAVAEINCCSGCPNGCRYCYAHYDLVVRKRLLSEEQWLSSQVNAEDVACSHPLYPGQVMFPSHHDIVSDNLNACLLVLDKLLSIGNRVLIVSKPRLDCVSTLCAKLMKYREHILFRFTITARDSQVLLLWEPNAPGYSERKSCLEFAFKQGFATSVSVEPMLDAGDVVPMVEELLPFVSQTLWLGKMNKIDERVAHDSVVMQKAITQIKKGQTDAEIWRIYRQLGDIDKIRWKESVKEVVGLPSVSQPGLDE